MKKNHKSSQYYRDEDSYEDRKPRHREKALRQNKDAKRIERALKRKDYKMLAEDLY